MAHEENSTTGKVAFKEEVSNFIIRIMKYYSKTYIENLEENNEKPKKLGAVLKMIFALSGALAFFCIASSSGSIVFVGMNVLKEFPFGLGLIKYATFFMLAITCLTPIILAIMIGTKRGQFRFFLLGFFVYALLMGVIPEKVPVDKPEGVPVDIK